MSDSTRSDELQPLTMTTSRPRPDVCVVQLVGELDAATAPLLADYLQVQTAAAPRFLLLDVAAVKFLAAAGVTLIVNALRNDRGIHGQVHLVGMTNNRSVERVLDVTGVRPLLIDHQSVGHALDYIDGVDRR